MYKIGICSRYTRHEAAYAAIRIADWATAKGHEVSLFSMSCPQNPVDVIWDPRVVHTCAQPFVAWCREYDFDAVLLTHIPHREMVEWLRTKGIAVYLLILWHELQPCDRPVLGWATSLLAPHHACFDYLRRWGLRNVVQLPWDTGNPFFVKSPTELSTLEKLYLPLYDGAVHRMERTLLEMLDQLLYDHSQTQLTISYSASTAAGHTKRRLRRLRQKFRDRVQLIAAPSLLRHTQLCSQHDLTLCPSEYENFGMVGLISASVGTPVICFDIPPLNEVLVESPCLVKVPRVRDNLIGIPRAIADYDLLYTRLCQLIQDSRFLPDLQKATMTRLHTRRQNFDSVMHQLLPVDTGD